LHPEDAVFLDVANFELPPGPSAGIRWRSLTRELVPVFEEHMVRKESGYTLMEWHQQLTHDERALEIAISRTKRAIEAFEAEAQSEAMESKAKKK